MNYRPGHSPVKCFLIQVIKQKEKHVDNLRENIKRLKNEIKKLSLIDGELAKAKEKKNKIHEQLEGILSELAKVNEEISKLEKFSLGGMIKSLFIDKKQALEEKRRHYYDLTKQYEKLKTEASAIDYEYGILNEKAKKLLKLEEELKALKYKRLLELQKEDSTTGISLRNILASQEREAGFQKKIAIANELIDRLLEKLTLLGAAMREVTGYNRVTAGRMRRMDIQQLKNKAINNAKHYHLESKLLLEKLRQVLSGIDDVPEVPVLRDIEFDTYFDMILGGIFSDLILKKRINDALQNLEYVYNRLRQIKYELKEKLAASKENHKRLEEIKDKILEE